MTTPPSLPTLAGLGWSRHKMPEFKTRVASHVSGREVRVPFQPYPLYEFQLVYNGLASLTTSTSFAQGLGASSLQSLLGFHAQMNGQAFTFLYTDPDDSTVSGGAIATGDGSTQTFLIKRTIGGFQEPVSWVTAVSAVYLNGVSLASSNWLFTAPNSLGFASAPGNGVAITADFTFAFQCRFLDDQLDFEEFMSNLWKIDQVKIRSVTANTTPAPVPPPTVLSISPNNGSTAGGTAVTITGTFFSGATSATIGGAACTGVTVVNPTTITATTPAGTAGTDSVAVTTPYGTGTGANLYTYTAPLLLDSITTAATAGYSTRLLRAAYAGKALRVRRDSDNTEQDIGFVSNLLDTASLLAFVGSGNGYITKWYDQSGNGYDQVQATQANQPQIVSSGTVVTTINGNPCLSFNGTSHKLLGAAALSSYVSASAYTLLALSRPTAGGAHATNSSGDCRMIFADPGQGYFYHGWGSAGLVAGHYGGGFQEVDLSTSFSAIYVSVQRYDHTNVNAYLNGGTGGATSSSVNIGDLTHAPGIGYAGFGAGGYFQGTISELITFNAALAKADENTLGANMASRGGVSWTTIT